MEFELLYDFTGLAGSELEVEPIQVTAEMRDKLIINPLKKEGLTNVVRNSVCVAEGWQQWDELSLQPPTAYMSSLITVKNREEGRLRLGSMSFALTRDEGGPRNWQWRASANGFESALPIENFPQEEIDRGCTHEDGRITLPEELPIDPPFFGPFIINFKNLFRLDRRWGNLEFLELRLIGSYPLT